MAAKCEQGRARFRQVAAGLSSTGQSLEKVKELLEETEREWLTQPATDEPTPVLRQITGLSRSARPANDRVPSAESSD